jgi:hypothetical protein
MERDLNVIETGHALLISEETGVSQHASNVANPNVAARTADPHLRYGDGLCSAARRPFSGGALAVEDVRASARRWTGWPLP